MFSGTKTFTAVDPGDCRQMSAKEPHPPLRPVSQPPYWRTLLVLGRVSNLPTVWSNCLVGWLLADGGFGDQLIVLCAGASCLYLGGMFLNDAFDADFDRQHRPARPIPSGAISLHAVWEWGLCWLLLGLTLLSTLGTVTALLAAFLAIAILIYDAVHKIFAFAPVLLGLCRFFLVVLAASTGFDGVTGLSIWSGLALAAYVAGLSFLARKESLRWQVEFWPCLLMAAPLVLALIINRDPPWAWRGLLLSALLAVWILRSLGFAYWSPQPSVGRAAAGLLAGIVLVDLLAYGGAAFGLSLVFLGLFLLAWISQQLVPAT
jgi:4-hydroxybenzoate polyprenyltransferase